MKPLIFVVALFAVEQQTCKNPLKALNDLTNPTATTSSTPKTPEAFCASVASATYGPAFYCGTVQANLQISNLPSGWTGYCMLAGETLGNTGYSATTFSGGADLVRSQANASTTCNALGSQCGSIIRCTRQ